MCRGRRARILLHLHIQREKIVLLLLPASGKQLGRCFTFAKQGKKMRRLRRRTSEGVEVWVDRWAERWI
jgi:hypothetical protein